jgi:hypothetical protein
MPAQIATHKKVPGLFIPLLRTRCRQRNTNGGRYVAACLPLIFKGGAIPKADSQ